MPNKLAPAGQAASSEKDWPEDFSHENGNYQNRCVRCEAVFLGHKRRVCCKTCDKPLPAPSAPAEDKSTVWKPVSHLPGYEDRLNQSGHKETRPIQPVNPPSAPVAYKCRSCKMTLTEAEKAVWVGCDVCDGEGLIDVPPSAEGVVSDYSDVSMLVPLSRDRITPEIRLMASRCILSSDDKGGSFSPDAHKYAAYTIIRERELQDALTSLTAAQRQADLNHRVAESRTSMVTKIAGEKAKLEAEVSSLRSQLKEETAIVDRILDIFGRPSYEELKGRSIYDLILELKAQLASRDSAEDAYNRGATLGAKYGSRGMTIPPYTAPKGEIDGK
jgi:hypothetical protein